MKISNEIRSLLVKNEMEENNSQLCLKNKQDKKVVISLCRFGKNRLLGKRRWKHSRRERVLVGLRQEKQSCRAEENE